MRQILRSLLASLDRDRSAIQRIDAMRTEFAHWDDDRLATAAAQANDLLQFIAIAATAAARVLRQKMFDVQLRAALTLVRGSVAEMQTGEGKTLAAVPAIAWFARRHQGVHVMTVNDYLSRRDARWMGDIYRLLGLSVGYVQQGMTAAERRAAYSCDITYATANEIGFDLLRDRLALSPDRQVHRPFNAAVIDEADSILIDEARIPLVVAGGDSDGCALAYVADRVARQFRACKHYTVDVGEHNAALTDTGIAAGGRIARLRKSLRSTEPPLAHRLARRPACARPAASRRGLPGKERRDRDGGRVQGQRSPSIAAGLPGFTLPWRLRRPWLPRVKE